MNIRTQVGTALISLMMTTSLVAADTSTTPQRPRFDTVVRMAAVTTRDAAGRPLRFTDAGKREFAVTYDAQQRVQSIAATRGPHLSDIVSVGYAVDGELAGVMFRSGYTLLYERRADGTQMVRDSRGAGMRQAKGSRTLQAVDGLSASEELAATAAEVESLMKALQTTRR